MHSYREDRTSKTSFMAMNSSIAKLVSINYMFELIGYKVERNLEKRKEKE